MLLLHRQSRRHRSAGTVADIVKGPSLLRTSVSTRPRPSLLQLPGLRALPFWTQQQQATDNNSVGVGTTPQQCVAYGDASITTAVAHLDAAWEPIWEEYQRVATVTASDYQTDTEHHTVLHQGSWDWHSYMRKGAVEAAFADRFPVTAGILEHFRRTEQLFEGTPFGYAFFSTLHANSNIQPHTAPMNLRLRVHLPLSVPIVVQPPNNSTDTTTTTSHRRPSCGIRVGAVTRQWQTGQCLVLDDSYEHEVWNDTAEPRVVLLVDLWHPDITLAERHEIVRMFDAAKEKGWLS
jgi:Aspartyl/Asparaginyl beta-hydroxylase